MAQGALAPKYLLQAGEEATWGTEVAATVRLLGAGRLLDNSVVVRPERDYGLLTRSVEDPVLVAEMPGLDFSSELSFEQILHILHAGVKGNVTAVEQTMGEGDYLWTFPSPVTADPAVDPFTLEGAAPDSASNIEAFTATGMLVTEFGIAVAFGENLAEMSATWVGKDLAAKAPTADPGIPSRRLIPADKFTVKLADTQAGLAGASALSGVVKSFDLSIVTGIDVKRRLNGATTAADKRFGAYSGTLTLDSDLIAAIETERVNFRAGTKRFLRLAVDGAQIASGVNRRIQIDLAAHIMEGPSDSEDDDQEGRSITYGIFHDTTWGFGYEFQVINTLATLP